MTQAEQLSKEGHFDQPRDLLLVKAYAAVVHGASIAGETAAAKGRRIALEYKNLYAQQSGEPTQRSDKAILDRLNGSLIRTAK